MENIKGNKPLVAVWSLVYNHEPYLRDYFEGIIMQKTDFPFVAIVHDDCSTDGSAAIIREYAAKYPDIIKPIFETENQYSKGYGFIEHIMVESIKATRAKYVALCEGDDYWIDPLKLQKQVDFLESSPEYSMCSTNIEYLENNNLKHSSHWNTYADENLSIKNIILNGGLYIGTASIMFRTKLYIQRPPAISTLHIGDYPLQIYLASCGLVRNLKDITCVYRYESEGSWTKKNRYDFNSIDKLKKYILKEQQLLEIMNEATHCYYRKYFNQRLSLFRFKCYYPINSKLAFRELLKHPNIIFKKCTLKTIVYIFIPSKFRVIIKNFFKF